MGGELGGEWVHVHTAESLCCPPETVRASLDACVFPKSPQSCVTLCDTTDHSPPVSSVHGILQTRILEWFSSPGDLLGPAIKSASPASADY